MNTRPHDAGCASYNTPAFTPVQTPCDCSLSLVQELTCGYGEFVRIAEMSYLATLDCVECRRPTCGYEHVRIDLSPAALAQILSHMRKAPMLNNQSVNIEVINFTNQLSSRLERWSEDRIGNWPGSNNENLI